MKILAGILLAAVFAITSSAFSWAAPADVPASARFLGACDIAFFVTSTLHDFSGSARCQPFTVDVDVDRLRVEMGKGREGDASFDLEFPVSLREFDLKAPSILGIIRVGDKVPVKVNFTLTGSRSPRGASNRNGQR